MRKQMIVGDMRTFIKDVSDDTPVFCAPSLVNSDEPEDTQEFILNDKKIECVAMEKTVIFVVLGYKEG